MSEVGRLRRRAVGLILGLCGGALLLLAGAGAAYGNDMEPNDGPATAFGPLRIGDQINGTMNRDGDLDFYKFHVTEQEAEVSFTFDTTGTQTDLVGDPAEGYVDIRNSQNEAYLGAGFGGDGGPTQIKRKLERGTYFVVVWEVGTGRYDYTFRVDAGVGDPPATGNTCEAAKSKVAKLKKRSKRAKAGLAKARKKLKKAQRRNKGQKQARRSVKKGKAKLRKANSALKRGKKNANRACRG